MHQKFSSILRFLTTVSFYFFLVFIPLNYLLVIILSVLRRSVDCPHQGCFDEWILPLVILNSVITVVIARKYGLLFSVDTRLELVIVATFLLFGGCCMVFAAVMFWDNVWGTFVEKVIHYPNSQLVRVDYGVYGSGDYGTKIHLRWTEDSVAQVEAHYDRFPLYRRYVDIINSEEDASEFTVCVWSIGFYYPYRNSPEHPCNFARRLLNERDGTMIEFNHSYFAG